RDDSGVEHVDAGAREARRDGGRDELSRDARIAREHRARSTSLGAPTLGVTALGQNRRRSLGEPEGEVPGDDITVRQPPNSVRSEESAHERGARRSALRELRGLAGLLETGLLTFDDAGVTREE